MTTGATLKHVGWLAAAGCSLAVVLWYVGALGPYVHPITAQYSQSEAASEYGSVLVQIQKAASVSAVISIAKAAGLAVYNPPTPSFSGGSQETVAVSDPKSGKLLATVTEYDDTFSAPPAAAVSFPGAPATPSSSPPSAPSVNLSASINSITLGNSFNLVWSSTGMTSCSASGSWSGAESISGTSQQAPGAAGTKTYTLTCSGKAGPKSASVSVAVSAASSGPGSGSGGKPPKSSKQPVSELFNPLVAFAQDMPGTGVGGATAEGNDTGQFAVCSVAGTNGGANVFVYPNGDINALSGANYNFSTSCSPGSSATDCQAAAQAAAQANAYIESVGGPHSEVLAPGTQSTNQIQAVVNENMGGYASGNLGVSLSVSTLQPDGTYADFCSANVPPAYVHDAVTSGNTAILAWVFVHEELHCMGLAHVDDPRNIMYPDMGVFENTYFKDDSSEALNSDQFQLLRDISSGNTIQVEDCSAACAGGTGFSNATSLSGSKDCVALTTLCKDSGTTWNEETQSCDSCPDGQVGSATAPTTCQASNCYVAKAPVGVIPPTGEVLPTTCNAADGVSCTCDAGGATCVDASGESVPVPDGACQGSCSAGQVQTFTVGAGNVCAEQEVTDCSEDPDAPACAKLCDSGNPNVACGATPCSTDPYSPECTDFCSSNPTNASCPNADACKADPNSDSCDAFCSQNPDSPSCSTNVCDTNPSDPSCGGLCTQDPSNPDCGPICAQNPNSPNCGPGSIPGGGEGGLNTNSGCTIDDLVCKLLN